MITAERVTARGWCCSEGLVLLRMTSTATDCTAKLRSLVVRRNSGADDSSETTTQTATGHQRVLSRELQDHAVGCVLQIVITAVGSVDAGTSGVPRS